MWMVDITKADASRVLVSASQFALSRYSVVHRHQQPHHHLHHQHQQQQQQRRFHRPGRCPTARATPFLSPRRRVLRPGPTRRRLGAQRGRRAGAAPGPRARGGAVGRSRPGPEVTPDAAFELSDNPDEKGGGAGYLRRISGMEARRVKINPFAFR